MLVGDLKPRPHEFPAEVRYRCGDLNFVTSGELAHFAPEVFIHLAATFERSTETYDFWDENYRHNIALSHHLMSCLKDSSSLRRVVFASSYLIYDPALYNFEQPRPTATRLRENDPIRPRNLTGAAKLNHEIELGFLMGFRREQFECVAARIYRSYGKHSRDVISRWIRMLLEGETLQVFRPEGRFDYVFAGDVAEGLCRLCEMERPRPIYNLGTGRSRTVSDVLEVLAREFPALRAVDVDTDIAFESSEADMSGLAMDAGWGPGRSIDDVIPELVAHERAYPFDTQAEVPRGRSVLVSSAARKIPLITAIGEALSKLGAGGKVVAGDADAECLASRLAPSFWNMPRIATLDPEQVIAVCRQRQVTAIVPTRDGELQFWARSRARLREAGIAVMVSSPEAVQHCLDKVEFAAVVSAAGLASIPTITDADEIPAAWGRLVVKERFGAGARSQALDVGREAALDHAALLDAPVFQPFIRGTEISADVYVTRAGQCKGVVLRTRDMVIAGESQVTTTFRDAALEGMVSRLAARLGLYGHAVIQLIRDTHGKPWFMECNARFGGASTLSIAAGLDSFYWFLLEAAGENLRDHPFDVAQVQLQQLRYPSDTVVAFSPGGGLRA